MESRQDFWEKLKSKYEDKNQNLQHREQELRLQLEAIGAINGGSRKINENLPTKITDLTGRASTYGVPIINEIPTTNFMLSNIPQSIQQQSSRVSDQKFVYKNENCMCNPCEVDVNDKQSSNTLQNQQRGRSDGIGDDCSCSVCSKYSIFDTNSKKLCPCSLSNPAGTGALATALRNIGSPSKLSLNSADLHYMKNIHDLATQQRDLLKQVNDLEQKEKIYENLFAEYKNVDVSTKTKCPCTCAGTSTTNQKTNAQLKLENFLLKNELKDMRLEVRQYLERMEGPMQFKIESERYKSVQLEEKLEEAKKKHTDVQDLYETEINSLKMQLCDANTNLYNLNSITNQTNLELQKCQQRHSKLENDLIRQKLSEAETIKSLQAALCCQTNVKDECDLHQIARGLSKILRECEPCGDCMNLPEDLTSAARLLKSLTDMVELKLNSAEQDRVESNSDLPTTAILEPKEAVVLEDDPTRDIASVPETIESTPQVEGTTSETSNTSSAKQE